MWQIFLSHNISDSDFSRKLAIDLLAHGIKVWFDEWEMRVGDSLRKKIQEGIRESGYLGVVLSPDSVNSRWVQAELNAGLEREMHENAIFVLPILYRKCDIPPFLQDKLYADFTEDYDKGLKTLLRKLDTVAYAGEADAGILGLIPKEILTKLLDDFSTSLNAGITVFQEPSRIITSEKIPLNSFCRAIRRCNVADRLCYNSDRYAISQVKLTKAPMVYEGHPGILDVCAPVTVDDKVVAILLSGQLRIREINKTLEDRLHEWEKTAELPHGLLVSSLRKIPLAQTSDVQKTIQTLEQAASKISKIWSKAEKKKIKAMKSSANLASPKTRKDYRRRKR